MRGTRGLECQNKSETELLVLKLITEGISDSSWHLLNFYSPVLMPTEEKMPNSLKEAIPEHIQYDIDQLFVVKYFSSPIETYARKGKEAVREEGRC